MGLKQDIVIVNEYTVPLPGGGGSRGGTPGAYVTRYMARDGATETLAPIRRNRTDDFILRYMARSEATEALDVQNAAQLKGRMSQAQGQGGMAFGYGSISLSHDQLEAAAADLQRRFESEGRTVMKTVLSLGQDYLRKHGIVPEDFEVTRPGDYRGEIDQMKLRLAITHGLDRMGRSLYDELRWVGVIQVDTEHVHCHLSMLDAGRGTVMPDGTQRGKIDERAKSLLRRGMDSWLDEKQQVAHLSSAVGYERRNVTAFVKRWAHQQALRESLPQFLLATLPADRRLWRADTNHQAMRRPNQVVHELVDQVLSAPGSPMGDAMARVHEYANTRREQESLTNRQWAGLVETGRERIIERGVNAVYATLRQLPSDALRVRTPMLDVLGMDYEELASRATGPDSDAEDDLVGFSFRLRSYSTRLAEHTSARQENQELARSWERQEEVGIHDVNPSRALYLWYLEEEEYQAKLAAKYRYFLPFGQNTQWRERWDEIAEYTERMLSLESMSKDASLKRTKDLDEAERLGRLVYGQSGGHLVAAGDDASRTRLANRIEAMRTERERKVAGLRSDLAASGMVLRIETDDEGHQSAAVGAGTEYPFDEVKGLDLHHMRYDFSHDVPIGRRTRARFIEAAERRAAALEDAIDYVEGSDQPEVLEELPIDDVRAMVSLARQLQASPEATLPSEVARIVASRKVPRSRTVRLGAGLATQVSTQVTQEVASTDVTQLYGPAGTAEPATPGES